MTNFICPNAQAFLNSSKGYLPLVEEVIADIENSWKEVDNLYLNRTLEYSTKHLLNHLASILDEIMRLAMLGPVADGPIVLFDKSKSRRIPHQWKFSHQIWQEMGRKSPGLSAARFLYRLRNDMSSHRCLAVNSSFVSEDNLKLVKQYVEDVLNFIMALLDRGEE